MRTINDPKPITLINKFIPRVPIFTEETPKLKVHVDIIKIVRLRLIQFTVIYLFVTNTESIYKTQNAIAEEIAAPIIPIIGNSIIFPIIFINNPAKMIIG